MTHASGTEEDEETLTNINEDVRREGIVGTLMFQNAKMMHRLLLIRCGESDKCPCTSASSCDNYYYSRYGTGYHCNDCFGCHYFDEEDDEKEVEEEEERRRIYVEDDEEELEDDGLLYTPLWCLFGQVDIRSFFGPAPLHYGDEGGAGEGVG